MKLCQEEMLKDLAPEVNRYFKKITTTHGDEELSVETAGLYLDRGV